MQRGGSPLVPLLRSRILAEILSLVIADVLAPIDRIDAAYLFGSWAARYSGERGRAPADIDVLVIGSPDRDQVDDAIAEAEQ
jgi:predicted nucleotidyltransferase